jgi:hypothetical protein
VPRHYGDHVPWIRETLELFQELRVWLVSQYDDMRLKVRSNHQEADRESRTSSVPSNGFLTFQISQSSLLRVLRGRLERVYSGRRCRMEQAVKSAMGTAAGIAYDPS